MVKWLMKIGAKYAPLLADARDDLQAFDRAWWAAKRETGDPEGNRPESTLALSAIRWASNGYPQVVLGHRLAASLMATVVAEGADELWAPWGTFIVRLPLGLLHVVTATPGQYAPASLAIVESIPAGAADDRAHFQWRVISESSTHFNVRSFNRVADLATGGTANPRATPTSLDTAALERAAALTSRLIAGVLIELGAMGGAPAIPPRNRYALPKAHTVRLRRDVTIDCRPWVRSYLEGIERQNPLEPVLVCGHHKRQPYGPGRTLRKWIHVEPYFRNADLVAAFSPRAVSPIADLSRIQP